MWFSSGFKIKTKYVLALAYLLLALGSLLALLSFPFHLPPGLLFHDRTFLTLDTLATELSPPSLCSPQCKCDLKLPQNLSVTESGSDVTLPSLLVGLVSNSFIC